MDVFISYSSRNKAIAEALCATLERQQIRCWIAPRDIVPGQDWSEAIIDAICSCRTMVLLFSSHSNISEQVKREVSTAVTETKPIIPFRVEDVPLSKHMRYFIGMPQWLDALTPPLECHLNYLAETIHALLASRRQLPNQQPLSEAPAPFSAKQAGVVHAVLPTRTAPTVSDDEALRRQETQLSFTFEVDGHLRNVCLFAQPIVTLGKERCNDIVLRVLPRSPENDECSGRISRRHAELHLDGDRAEWVNLNCRNGTLVDGSLFPAQARFLIDDGQTVSPGGVLSLACDLYAEAADAASEPLPVLGLAYPHVSALRLRRMDRLAGLEQYVVFEHRVAVGSEPACPVLIVGAGITGRFAEIAHSAAGFELETLRKDVGIKLDGCRLVPGEPAPLRPGASLQLGDVMIQVGQRRQLYLDFRPG